MIFQLDIPIYGTNVLFVVSPTKEEMEEFLSVKQNRQKLTEEEFTTLFKELDNTEYGEKRLNKHVSVEVKQVLNLQETHVTKKMLK